MTIGVRVGVGVGLRVGVAVGVSSNETGPDGGTGDGPNGAIKVPMTAGSFLATTGRNATHAYTCQEASGNLIDQIGAMNLVPGAGAPTYLVPVTGWTRKGVGFNRSNNQGFTVNAGVGPNPTLTPVAMMVYYTTRSVVGQNELMMISDGGVNQWAVFMDIGAGGIPSTFCGTAINNGTVSHQDGAVHVMLGTYDPAGSINRYTDLERDDGTFAAGVVDGVKGIGSDGSQASHLGEILAYWIMQGADAQFTALQAKTFLQSLGWAPPWAAP